MDRSNRSGSHKPERQSLLEHCDSASEDERLTTELLKAQMYHPPDSVPSGTNYGQEPGYCQPAMQANPQCGSPPSPLVRTSSIDTPTEIVQKRPTWARNDKGTYLPA
jgi:hypothetical protein